MNTKLTLRMDDALIERAKKYARREGKSLSQIVADHFRAIWKHSLKGERSSGPITSRLRSCLKGTEISEEEYRRHLERKYL